MRRIITWIVGCAILLGGSLQAQDISGNWQGTLPGIGRRILVKIKNDDGKLRVFYSIDQGGQHIAITSISLQGTVVTFSIKPSDITYTGTLNPDGNSISGSRTQRDQSVVLNLQRVSDENTWAIPEPPKPMPAYANPKLEATKAKADVMVIDHIKKPSAN